MRGLRVAIIILLLVSLIAVGNAQQANYSGQEYYSGHVKIVVQIVSQENIPGPFAGDYEMSPGYIVKVISSEDTAIKTGQNYYLQTWEPGTDPANPSYDVVTFKELTPGTIISFNDYGLENHTIEIYLSGRDDNALHQKVTILGTASTGSNNPTGDTKNDNSMLSTPGLFSSTPTMGAGNSLFNVFSTSPFAYNSELQPSTVSGNNGIFGLNQPFNTITSGIMPGLMMPSSGFTFPSFETGQGLFQSRLV